MEENHLLNYFSYEELEKIANMEDLITKSKIIVTRLFENKLDKAGKSYIGHLLRVSDRLNGTILKSAGLLHDVVEDTVVTFEDLFEVGIPLDVIEIIRLVTHDKVDKINMTKSEKLELYNKDIDKIINSGNMHAIRLKEADMSDNYDPDRIKELPLDKQEWFREKYEKQLIKLRKAKGEMNI